MAATFFPKSVELSAKTSLNILKGLRNDLADNSTDLGKKVSAIFKAINDFEEAFPDA